MPSHVSADHPAAPPPGRGSVDALISQTRQLKGQVDAVRRDAAQGDTADPRDRWQRALCDLALHQLNDLDEHLAQLREGPPPVAAQPVPARPGTATPGSSESGSLLSRVGSAEWNLLTDAAVWSAELYQILGRDPLTPALTLDELPALVLDEDRPKLTAMVTDCLVDARPIDGEFRVERPDGSVRSVHMMGEPVLDSDGVTTSMWAVVRDISELSRSRTTVRETRDSLRDRRPETEHPLAVELQEAVRPPWHGATPPAHEDTRGLGLAARRLPSATGAPLGGDWFDALELPDGDVLLTVGDLTGHGLGVTSNTAMLLGAVRGMAMAGTAPGQLMSWLNQLIDTTAEPTLGTVVCCRYRPATRTLVWAQAGRPAPLLFRGGTGRLLTGAGGVLLGTAPRSGYTQAEVSLEPGDLLLLHTDGLVPGHDEAETVDRLLALAPRFGAADTAEDCVQAVVAELGETGREDDACVLLARVTY